VRILITRAAGFVGRRLVSKLIALGHECRCVVPRDQAGAWPFREDVDVVDGEATSPRDVLSWVAGCTHVVHLGDEAAERGPARQHHERADTEEIANLIAACEAAGVHLLVYCSLPDGIGVYGHASWDERAACRPQTPWEADRFPAEHLVLEATRRGRIRAIVARIDFVYGPEDVRLLPLYSAIQKGRFFLVGKGDAPMRPTYVEDAAEGLIACLAHPEHAGEIFNIGGPDRLTAREFVRGIQGAMGAAPTILFIPRFMAYAGALVCEGLSPVTARAPQLTTGGVRFRSVHHCPSVEKAHKLLGFRARTSFSTGIARTVAWFRTLGERTAADRRRFS